MAVTIMKIALVICGLATLEATIDPEKLRQEQKVHFDGKDSNKDGKLTMTEVFEYFDKKDANKDGAMTLIEMYGSTNVTDIPDHTKNIFKIYDEFDGNVDGQMLRSVIQSFFHTLDTNADHSLDFNEAFAPLKKLYGQ